MNIYFKKIFHNLKIKIIIWEFNTNEFSYCLKYNKNSHKISLKK